MKLMTQMWFHANATIRELNIGYGDWVSSISAYAKIKENRNKLMEAVKVTSHLKVKDIDHLLHDVVKKVSASITVRDKMDYRYLDQLLDAVCHMTLKDRTRRHRDSVRIIDPDDYKRSRLVYTFDYDKEEEELILHNIPIPTSHGDETITVDIERDPIDDETLVLG